MKYLILFFVILGLSACDLLITIIKTNLADIKSCIQKKLCECVVMVAVCGFAIGLEIIGTYYQCTKLSECIGVFISGSIFMRIMITNTINILENYAELNPDAAWVKKMTNKLKKLEN